MAKKILVIEDNNDIRESIAETLELNNYEVFTAENGNTGLEAISRVNPDVILCDIMMPEADGYQVLKAIHEKPDLSSIPFIFMTAKSSDSLGLQTQELGIEGYLTKPFDEEQLLWAIRKSLHN